MKRHLAMLVVLAGCPQGNPSRLWLAPDQMETAVALVDKEPGEF